MRGPAGYDAGMRRLLLAFLALAPATAAAQPAPRPPDPAKQVIVLWNDAEPEAKGIAEHYAARRAIPAANLCRVTTTTAETIGWLEFREQILRPLGRFLERFPEALYLVPVYGIPLRISEETPENDAPADGPPGTVTKWVTGRDYASVDAELALIPQPGHDLEGWLDSEVYGKDEPLTPAHRLFLVSRLDGPTPAVAKALVDRAVYAETYGLSGGAGVDARGLDPATALGKIDAEIRRAKEVFEAAGIACKLEDTAEAADLSGFADCAFYWGWSASDWTGTGGFAFRPGAVAAHLHASSAATLRQPERGWVGPLLAHGAACAAGTAYEPLVTGFPSMTVVFDRLLKGYTWGEACAMGNLKLSWMAVFAGDPLYAPFAPGLRERQEKNRSLASDGWTRAAAALDAGDLDGAAKIVEDIRGIGVPLQGARDISFLSREIASRRIGKPAGPVEELVKKLEEAQAARGKGDDKAAQGALEKAVALSPSSFDANLALGRLLVDSGRAQAALAPLEKAQKVFPADPALREPLGRALAANGKYEAAIPLLSDAVQDGAGPDATAALGDCFLKTRQSAKAVLFLTEATAKSPRNRAAFAALARAHEDLKDFPSAFKAFKSAVRIYPSGSEDITAWKNVWKAYQLTALHSGDRREKEDVDWVLRDFDNPEHQPPTRGQAVEIQKQADAAAGGESPVGLGTIPTDPLKVPGLPRLVVGNASSADVTVFLKGPCARLLRLPPLGAAGAAGKEYGVFPGDYEVVVVVKRGSDRTVLRTSVTFEISTRYGMILDNSLAMVFPAK